MKKSPDHLPREKRDELQRLASVIRDLCDDLEMIILFGSYARGDFKVEADLKPDRKSGHASDYDILAVVGSRSTVKDSDVWHAVSAECRSLGLSAYPRVIVHDVEFLNERLADGLYFYCDIKKEGCLLYDSGNVELAEKRRLSRADQRRIAQMYYDERFTSASQFFDGYGFHLSRKHYKLAAFNLNQVAEASYKTILLVHSFYCPQEHRLEVLSKMAAQYATALHGIFPKGDRVEEELFERLDYAYIGARYDADFRIAKPELEWLAERVKILLDLTEKLCTGRIEGLCAGD